MDSPTQEFRLTPTAELHLHPRNPRVGDIEGIRASMRANGFYGVIVAQKSTGLVIKGNHTLQAAVLEGFEEVPVAWVDVDDETATRILLVDNRESDKATYQDGVLAGLLRELEDSGVGLEGTGYDVDDLAELERLTGELGRKNSEFLDDILDKDDQGPLEPAEDDDDPVDEAQFFSVSYLFTNEERKEVFDLLNRVRDEEMLESSAAALLLLVREEAKRRSDVSNMVIDQ